MAIDWLTVLKTVPWSEVIKRAPEVADSAKRFWSNIASKSSEPDNEVEAQSTLLISDNQEIAWLKERLATLEAVNSDLHNQMLASSEFIKVLADQNIQLINAVELNRKRIVWLTILMTIIGILAFYSLVATFSH